MVYLDVVKTKPLTGNMVQSTLMMKIGFASVDNAKLSLRVSMAQQVRNIEPLLILRPK